MKTKPTPSNGVVTRKRRPHQSPTIVFLRTYSAKVAGAICALLYLLSRIENPLQSTARKFFYVNYYDPTQPAPNQYGRGYDDFYFVAFWAVAFFFIRGLVQRYILEPIAKWNGIAESNKLKFLEQGWLFLYYAISETYGVYLWTQLPTWHSLDNCWTDYPHSYNPLELKVYFLVQWGFWIASSFMLFIDVRRKDFVEYIAHHLVVMFLIGGAFAMNFFRVAHIVLIEQDLADILLPLAKMFHYAKRKRFAEVTFITFVLAWIATRHVWYFFIVWSVYVDSPNIIGPGKWDPTNDSYHNMSVVYFFCLFFALLQALMIFWLYLILKMIYALLFNPRKDGKEMGDVRSDDEDEAVTKKSN